MVAVDLDFSGRRAAATSAHARWLSLGDRRVLVAALVALVALRLLLIFWLPVTDSTEARYIEIARKMLVSGDWITPQFDVGVPFWGKPPLHTWLSAIGMKLFGIGHFGARILIFLTSAAVVLLCADWVARERGRDQALVAAVVMASSLMFFGAAAFVMTDMVMVLGTVLSMVAFHTCVTAATPRRRAGYLFFIGLAIGLLAKGPVATVLTGLPIFLWLLAGRRWHLLGRLPWATGLLLMLALTLPWYLAAEIKTPGFLHYFIVGEHFERFVVPGWSGDLYGSGHVQPKGMIWLFALGVFLPWTGFALALLARAGRVAGAVRGDATGWLSYLGFWSLSPLILFTPAANILPAYALPAIPPAAILLTALWAEVRGRPGRVSRLAVAGSLLASLSLFLAVALMAQFAPLSLTRKSEMTLVAEARRIDPDMTLTYWGGRSPSGEFYSGGTAQSATDTVALRALLSNGRRDAIAVAPQSLAEVSAVVGTAFLDVGTFGRRLLLVETPTDGKKP